MAFEVCQSFEGSLPKNFAAMRSGSDNALIHILEDMRPLLTLGKKADQHEEDYHSNVLCFRQRQREKIYVVGVNSGSTNKTQISQYSQAFVERVERSESL